MIYYNGIYWNDYAKTQDYLNRLATGSPELHWGDYIKKYCKDTKFTNALIPHCGDGHIERMLIDKNIISKAVGTDWSEDLLAQASKVAEKRNLPIQYFKVDSRLKE